MIDDAEPESDGDNDSAPAPVPDPEFRGVTILEGGQFRLTNVSISIGEDGRPAAGNLEYEVRNELWHHWLAIAETAVIECQRARDANPGPDSAEEFGRQLSIEMRQGMVAMCASAFAVEAFTASLVHAEPAVQPPKPPPGRTTTAFKRIAETWRRAFTIRRASFPVVRDTLRQVFELRNMAVHPPSGWVVPQLHPVFKVAIDTRYLWFRIENIRLGPPIIRHFLHELSHSKRPKYDTVRAWAENQAKLLGPDADAPGDGAGV